MDSVIRINENESKNWSWQKEWYQLYLSGDYEKSKKILNGYTSQPPSFNDYEKRLLISSESISPPGSCADTSSDEDTEPVNTFVNNVVKMAIKTAKYRNQSPMYEQLYQLYITMMIEGSYKKYSEEYVKLKKKVNLYMLNDDKYTVYSGIIHWSDKPHDISKEKPPISKEDIAIYKLKQILGEKRLELETLLDRFMVSLNLPNMISSQHALYLRLRAIKGNQEAKRIQVWWWKERSRYRETIAIKQRQIEELYQMRSELRSEAEVAVAINEIVLSIDAYAELQEIYNNINSSTCLATIQANLQRVHDAYARDKHAYREDTRKKFLKMHEECMTKVGHIFGADIEHQIRQDTPLILVNKDITRLPERSEQILCGENILSEMKDKKSLNIIKKALLCAIRNKPMRLESSSHEYFPTPK
tara:strand:+ start:75 stop:1322 length:1248 start_codon:yes stop_codon:yes gene_type:complete